MINLHYFSIFIFVFLDLLINPKPANIVNTIETNPPLFVSSSPVLGNDLSFC